MNMLTDHFTLQFSYEKKNRDSNLAVHMLKKNILIVFGRKIFIFQFDCKNAETVLGFVKENPFELQFA